MYGIPDSTLASRKWPSVQEMLVSKEAIAAPTQSSHLGGYDKQALSGNVLPSFFQENAALSSGSQSRSQEETPDSPQERSQDLCLIYGFCYKI